MTKEKLGFSICQKGKFSFNPSEDGSGPTSQISANSETIEFKNTRDILAAVIEQQAEGDGNVEVDSEDVGFNGGAEAGGGFEVDKTANERAARGGGGASDDKIRHQATTTTIRRCLPFPQFRLRLSSATATTAEASIIAYAKRHLDRGPQNRSETIELAAPTPPPMKPSSPTQTPPPPTDLKPQPMSPTFSCRRPSSAQPAI
nr:hypothetical protein B296_00020504 [Ipomoea batatas]